MKERRDFHLLKLVFKALYSAPSHLTSRSMRLSIHVCCVLNAAKRFTLSTAVLHEKTLTASCFLWINMTNSPRKKSYSENTEFSCWLVVIVFPYDDPLSVHETTIANQGNIFGNYFYLSISRLINLFEGEKYWV